MTQHAHAVVCIDHAQALILDFSKDAFNERRITADLQSHVHHNPGPAGSGHLHDAKSYFTAVVKQLELSQEILIVGHGNAKTEFAHYIRDHVPAVAPRIMGVETVDNPSSGELLALARRFFQTKDLTTPQLAT